MPARTLSRLAVTLVAAGVALLGLGTPALAHVDVNSSSPSLGEVVASSPVDIILELSGPPGNINVDLLHRDGREVPLTGDGVEVNQSTVTVRPPVLDDGTYVLVWSSIGPDGHLAAGQVHFSVGAASGPVGDLATPVGASAPTDTAVRYALYLAIGFALGLGWLLWAGLAQSSPRLRRVMVFSAAAAIISLVAYGVSVVAKLTSAGAPLSMLVSEPLVATGWIALFGATAWLSVLSFAAHTRPSSSPALFTAAALMALAVNMTGHLAVSASWPALVLAGVVHLLAAGLWLGAPLAFLALGSGIPVAVFARKLAPVAVGAVVLVALSGIALLSSRFGLANLSQWWQSDYGSVVALKLLVLLSVLPIAGVLAFLSWRSRHNSGAPTSKSTPPEQGMSSDDGAAGAFAVEPDKAADPSDGFSDASSASPGSPARAQTSYRKLIFLEAVGLSIVLLGGAVLAGLPTPSAARSSAASVDVLAAPASLQECASPDTAAAGTDQGASSLLCFARYFENQAQTSGVPVALAELTSAWQAGGSWIQSYCHALGHKLGRLGYRIHGSIETAFAQGSDPCDYGYLHGVIEAASADFSDSDLLNSMTSLCEVVGGTDDHTYRQCIHGLGHAAARRVNNDLSRAMDFCLPYRAAGASAPGTRPENWAPNDIRFFNCVTGVAMEWNSRPQALSARDLPVGAPGTLMSECLSLDEVFHEGCLEYGTSQIGPTFEREVEARQWCDANLDDPLPCYRSIGRDVIWSESITDEQAVEVCLGGKKGIYAAECITRALGSVATIALDADAIDDFCPVLPPRYQGLCPVVRDAMRTQLEQTVKGTILPRQSSSQAATS